MKSPADLHVALFVPTLSGGGAERVFVQLANGLAARVRRADLLVARRGGHYEQLLSPSVNLVSFDKARTLATILPLRRYMEASRPDVLMSTMTDANIVSLVAALLARRPPPVAIREAVLMSGRLRSSLKLTALKWLAKLLYPRANGVAALSQGVADELERIIPAIKRPIRVVYNPAPSPGELALEGSVSDAFNEAKRLGPAFVAVGRLSEQKDNATLIRAFARIRQRIPSTLWILGEGNERTALEALAGDLGVAPDVFMPGFIKDPYPYMRAADVFVMSSKYEGGPNSMLQAMACGCKIVSTDAPSGPAEFLENGKQGYLVPVGDDVAFAAAMWQALRSPVPADRETSMERFQPDWFVEQFLQFLHAVSIGPPGYASQTTSAR